MKKIITNDDVFYHDKMYGANYYFPSELFDFNLLPGYTYEGRVGKWKGLHRFEQVTLKEAYHILENAE